MPPGPGHQPLAKGEVYDRPQFEESLDFLWYEYERSKLAFDDAFKDSSRHDQIQLFDSMIARGDDFLRLGRNLLSTESPEVVRKVCEELLRFDFTSDDAMALEVQMTNAVGYMVGELHRSGYVIQKRKPVIEPSDRALQT